MEISLHQNQTEPNTNIMKLVNHRPGDCVYVWPQSEVYVYSDQTTSLQHPVQ